MIDIQIPPHLVVGLQEELLSGQVTLTLRNGIKVNAHRTQFINFEQYKQNVRNKKRA